MTNTEKNILKIVQACQALGWSISIDAKDDEIVKGMIIGTEEYMDSKIGDKPSWNPPKKS